MFRAVVISIFDRGGCHKGAGHHRILPEKFMKHGLSWGVGGKLAVQNLTHWGGLDDPWWEHEADLDQDGRQVVRKYWLDEPVKLIGDSTQNRKYRIHLSRRIMAYGRGGSYVALGYKVPGQRRDVPDLYNPHIVGF